MNNKISVFGSTGFIGKRFCELYKNEIIQIPRDDRESKSNEVLYLISTVDNYNIHKDLQIDINTNLTILMEVLEKIKNNKDIIFNFVSSWFVYGQNYEIPFREDYSKCNPTGFYSITKHCAEQMLICFCNTFNIKYRIFRLANVIGEGDNKISKKKNALQYFIKEIVNNKDIHLYYNGEVLRDYIYVDDVCEAIKICITKSLTNQIYNIGNGNPYRFLDLINKAIKYSNSSSKIINIDTPIFHKIVQIRHSYLDTSKLKLYGFECKYNIEDVIKLLVEYYKNENNK